MTRTRPLPTVFALFLIAACGDSTPRPTHVSRETPLVVATTPPLACFAARIGAELVDVEPFTFTDSSDVDGLARLSSADVILFNGAGQEHWASHVSLPVSRVVDTSAGFGDDFVRVADGVAHSHGSGAAHVHERILPYTWVDPENASKQAHAVLDALVAALPQHTNPLHERHSALAVDLADLSARLRRLAESDVTLLAASEQYGYLARRFGFRIVSVPLDIASPLREEDTSALRRAMNGRDIRIVLTPEGMCLEAERDLAALGLAAVVFATCEEFDVRSRAAGWDYVEVQRANLARLSELLE